MPLRYCDSSTQSLLLLCRCILPRKRRGRSCSTPSSSSIPHIPDTQKTCTVLFVYHQFNGFAGRPCLRISLFKNVFSFFYPYARDDHHRAGCPYYFIKRFEYGAHCRAFMAEDGEFEGDGEFPDQAQGSHSETNKEYLLYDKVTAFSGLKHVSLSCFIACGPSSKVMAFTMSKPLVSKTFGSFWPDRDQGCQ